jgi:hypothetical protein
MSTVRFTAEVLADGTIRLPEGVQLAPGKAEITVEQSPNYPAEAPQRRSLAEWAESQAESWGDRLRADDVDSFTGRGD